MGEALDQVLRPAGVRFLGITECRRDDGPGDGNEACPLNPSLGAASHLDDPRVTTAFGAIGANLFPALENLERLASRAR